MDILSMHAQSTPDKAALICDGEPITYADLEERANRLANALTQLGVAARDKCTTVGYNAPEQFVVGSATRKILAVGVPMNYRLKPAEMSYQLQNSDSVAVFCGPDHVGAVEEIADACPQLAHRVAWGHDDLPDGWHRLGDLVASGDPSPPSVEATLTGPSMLYTAGTTGKPKGAYREGGTDPAVLGTYTESLDMRPEDVHLVAGPLYHSAPAAFSAINIVLGGTNVLMRRFDAAKALELVDRHGVQTTFMAPTLLQRIVDLPTEEKGRHDLSSMRSIIVAAAPCPTSLKERVIELFGEVLYEFYGSSETGLNTVLKPHEQLERPGSCGRVVPGCDIKIVDAEGNECPPTEPGEIYVKGPSIITNYYRRPQETEESWLGEYFTVGDVGYFDSDGYLYISDRKRDMIISGGANIYSTEIEDAIHSHPKVQDCAVFGIPSSEWGEAVHAVVLPQPGETLTASEIVGWVGERIADYKKPRSVEFVGDFPRDEAGKIRKRELREPYWEGREARV